MIVAVTGSSGFIGRRLIARLQREGYTPRALGRHDPRIPGVGFAPWDATAGAPAPDGLRDAVAIVHLAGEPVAQRWSQAVKRRIRESRVLGTRNLVSALGRLRERPRVLIAASAIG
jgi:NAD dependent epimerase/dehydratase family enzyme